MYYEEDPTIKQTCLFMNGGLWCFRNFREFECGYNTSFSFYISKTHYREGVRKHIDQVRRHCPFSYCFGLHRRDPLHLAVITLWATKEPGRLGRWFSGGGMSWTFHVKNST